MSRQLTRKQAEAALAAIKKQFAEYLEDGCTEPKLYEPGFHTTGWSIGWDDGPCDWPQLAFHGGFNEDMYYEALAAGSPDDQARKLAQKPSIPVPPRVFPEAVNSSILGLYRED